MLMNAILRDSTTAIAKRARQECVAEFGVTCTLRLRKTSHKVTSMMMNAPESRAPWMTAQQGAAYLGIDSRTLLLWARQGKVKGYKLSGTQRHVWRFLVEDLDASMMQAPAVLESKGVIQ
jgi:excisionase family DNA binding protein